MRIPSVGSMRTLETKAFVVREPEQVWLEPWNHFRSMAVVVTRQNGEAIVMAGSFRCTEFSHKFAYFTDTLTCDSDPVFAS